MKRMLAALAADAAVAAAVIFAAPAAFAGSPHFVGTPVYTVSGSTVTVQAKEAGLGDEAQIVAVLTGTLACVNPGGNQPSAANKTSFTTTSAEPVQNGKADYTITGTGDFQPSCSPPMTVQVVSLQLQDTTNGLTVTPVPAS